jgi:hypothetical protein
MNMISTRTAAELIRSSGGAFFSVAFQKRTTGELRDMVCRIGVTRHLHGGELSFNPAEKGLLIVFDAQKQGYRSIAIEGIQRLAIDGQVFDVTPMAVAAA